MLQMMEIDSSDKSDKPVQKIAKLVDLESSGPASGIALTQGDIVRKGNQNANEDDSITSAEKLELPICGIAGLALEIIEEHLIPIEYLKMLPSFHKRTLGFASAIILFAIFVGFSVQGYLNSIYSEYIALDTSDGICEHVARPIKGKYLISDDGYWEGAIGFQYSHALISLELNNYVADQNTFASDMESLDYVVDELVNSVSKKQNLAWNLLILMEQRNSLSLNGFNQIVSFTATPSDVFSTESLFMSMASKHQGSCPVYSFPSFYSSESLLIGSLDKDALVLQCNRTYPRVFSQANINASSTLTIAIDMNGFSTATAINMGFADLSILEQIIFPESLGNFYTFVHPSGAVYQVGQFINPSHGHMNPIYCIFEIGGSNKVFLACVLRQDYTFFLPLLNHIGGDTAHDYGTPQFCDCTTDVGHSVGCNTLDIVASMLYFHEQHADILLYYYNMLPLITLLRRYNDTYYDPADTRAFYRMLTADAYEASVFTTRGSDKMAGMNFKLDGAPSYLFDDVFAFCGFDCSMLAVRFVDFANVLVSQYSYNLLEGSCAPIIQFDNWNNIVNNAPTTLVESYYRCREKKVIALYNAVGVAMGLEGLFLTLLSSVLLPIILCGVNKHRKVSSELHVSRRKPIPEHDMVIPAVTPREETLQMLANQLDSLMTEFKAGSTYNTDDPLEVFAYALFSRDQKVSSKISVFTKAQSHLSDSNG